MPDVLFTTQNSDLKQLLGVTGSPDEPVSAHKCTTLAAFTAHCSAPHPQSHLIQQELNSLPQPKREALVCAVDVFGDATTTLAALYDEHLATLDLQQTASLVGAGATASEARLTNFQKALVNYQRSLMKLRDHAGSGRSAGARRNELRAAVRQSYEQLQLAYQSELRRFVSAAEVGKNRGSALTSAQRGITVAERKRIRHIHVADSVKARQVARFAKAINHAGNTMILLDAGIRVNKVIQARESGQDWQRKLATEMTGFGFGGAAGILTGKAAVGAMTAIGLGLTPVGWVIMIGAAVAVGFAAASILDNATQSLAGRIYDRDF